MILLRLRVYNKDYKEEYEKISEKKKRAQEWREQENGLSFKHVYLEFV